MWVFCVFFFPDVVDISNLFSHAVQYLQLWQLRTGGDSIDNKWILACGCQEGG